jgi:hypothetical protein
MAAVAASSLPQMGIAHDYGHLAERTDLAGGRNSRRDQTLETRRVGRMLLESTPISETDTISAPRPAKFVDAVVAELSEDSVLLHCRVAGEEIDIQLPLALLDGSLRKYGQPVQLSLSRESGYRVPFLQARAPSIFKKLEGEADIDGWLDTL